MENEASPKIETFEALYRDYFASIYNYIYFRLGNHTEAEDLTADIFMRAYEYWGSFDEQKGAVRSWLGGIARNMVNTHFRKKMSKPQVVDISDLLDPVRADVNIEDDYQNKEAAELLLLQMNKLPEQHRELLAMKYFLGMTNRDIAKTTGMSESSVGVTVYRILGRLRKELLDKV